MRYFRLYILGIIVSLAILSCQRYKEIAFDPMSNYPSDELVCLDMDLQGVVNSGIVIPSEKQNKEGFVFTFNGKKGDYYKIYYQNESYKFPDDGVYANENFYGSWEDAGVGFKRIESDGLVTDSFRIVGNPRDEQKYYGSDISQKPYNEQSVASVIESIKSSPKYYQSVVEKAKSKGNSIEEQLALDARWIINANKNKGDVNHRWKRNPRVGEYSFMLVICDEQALKTIDERVVYISKTDENGDFLNPFGYFAKNKNKDIKVVLSPKRLRTRAIITPESGVFVDELKVKTMDYEIAESEKVGSSEQLYENALFEQFFCQVSKQYTLRNIPVVKDVVSADDAYTRAEYEANKTRFDSSQLMHDYPVESRILGTTLKVDEEKNGIILVNPGNKGKDKLQKESTGVRTRVGFTYGKFRGKIKFPVMLNDENIWNGLTNAFWLLNQENHEWNNRRPSKSGYIPRNEDTPNPSRLHDYFYSEIDIEIVKASKYWPQGYYKEEVRDKKIEDATMNNDVVYACTNWDLAATDPLKFSSGIAQIPYENGAYEAMRWSKLYKALTIRTAISNEVFKNDYYYYEIDWRPTEIIWRLGPTPDDMTVVGYMNEDYTLIPNNQMTCIMTQEYHYSEWWKPIVFWQGLIPYNKTDIEGEIFEIVVE